MSCPALTCAAITSVPSAASGCVRDATSTELVRPPSTSRYAVLIAGNQRFRMSRDPAAFDHTRAAVTRLLQPLRTSRT